MWELNTFVRLSVYAKVLPSLTQFGANGLMLQFVQPLMLGNRPRVFASGNRSWNLKPSELALYWPSEIGHIHNLSQVIVSEDAFIGQARRNHIDHIQDQLAPGFLRYSGNTGNELPEKMPKPWLSCWASSTQRKNRLALELRL